MAIKKEAIQNPSLLKEYFYLFLQRCRDVFWIRSSDYKEQIYVSPSFEMVWGVPHDYLYSYLEEWVSMPAVIFALTAHVDDDNKKLFTNYGFDAVYPKPLTYNLAKDLINQFERVTTY